MRTQFYTATTLDGYIATEDDSLEWLFALGELGQSSYGEFISQVGALAMGSATYEWMLRNSEAVVRETGLAWPYTQPTWVFTSRELTGVPGADISFVSGDVRPVHDAMRAAAGERNIWLVGGGELVGKFHDQGLLDELIVQVGSVVLGGGKPLLPRQILAPTLRLHDIRPMGPSMVELRYLVDKAAAHTTSPTTTSR